jgi:hypothetical protein
MGPHDPIDDVEPYDPTWELDHEADARNEERFDDWYAENVGKHIARALDEQCKLSDPEGIIFIHDIVYLPRERAIVRLLAVLRATLQRKRIIETLSPTNEDFV